MNRRLLARLAVLAVLAPLPACGGSHGGGTETAGGGSCVASLAGGELVITEFMADPAGPDGDGIEWFEVHNPGGAAIDLEGIGLVFAKADGTDAKGHLVVGGGHQIAPGAYMTFGAVIDEARPEYIDYGYGSDLGSMSNTSGELSLRCGDVVVDAVVYDATKLDDGVSAILDGNSPPDAAGNDDLSRWCTSPTDVEPFFTVEYGSPRQPNPACPLQTPDSCGLCYAGELLREAVAPEPGQLVITEVMANAGVTNDSVGEWFELKVTAGTFDLNCLQYGANTTKFAADPGSGEVVHEPTCRTVTAGDVLLFSQQQWTETDVVIKATLNDNPTETNPNPGVFIAYGGAILDEIHYPSAKDGIAWSLDPAWTTVDGNDDPAHFCAAYVAFAEGDLGTPGADNPACLQHPCSEGDTVREAVAPAPGDLLITEVHANASTDIGEPAGEWLELFAATAFDLNGLQLGKAADSVSYTFAGDQCLPVGPGYVLLARDGAPGMMLEPDATYTGLQLANTSGTLWIGVGDGELDNMAYESPADGVARQVDPTVVDAFMMTGDSTLNDPPEARCDATLAYPPFGTDLGTPGAQNTACDGPPPTGKCTDPDTMMDRDVDPPAPGELIITEFMANPTQASDATGEWFEVFADADFDLNGVELGKVWDPYTVAETIPAGGACLEVKAGQFVLFARSADQIANGGLPMPAYVTGISLANTSGGLFLGHGGVVLDHTAYTTTTEARATQLGAEFITPGNLDVAANDVELNFCAAVPLYNMLDAGTPGDTNLACGGGLVDPCFDVDLNAMRETVSPGPGDLVIAEFLANPSGTETDREWFEVLALADFDLNNVKRLNKFAPTPDEVAAAAEVGGMNCLAVAAGSRVLFARKSDPMVNGNLPPVDATFSFSLANNAGGIALAVGDVVLDAIQWASAQAEDVSRQLDPATTDPAQNDGADAAPWCAGAPSSPKQDNAACP